MSKVVTIVVAEGDVIDCGEEGSVEYAQFCKHLISKMKSEVADPSAIALPIRVCRELLRIKTEMRHWRVLDEVKDALVDHGIVDTKQITGTLFGQPAVRWNAPDQNERPRQWKEVSTITLGGEVVEVLQSGRGMHEECERNHNGWDWTVCGMVIDVMSNRFHLLPGDWVVRMGPTFVVLTNEEAQKLFTPATPEGGSYGA